MIKTDIYIGLNDQVTGEQKFVTDRYASLLKKVCMSYRVPFSFHLMEGGYIYESGEYTQENTLLLTLIDADPALVDEIARDLCAFFRQESVLITKQEVETYSVSFDYELPEEE